MVNPLITVIVTTFNRKVLLKRALDSVINQTYQNIEIILVDDCSSDRTEEFIKSYKENYNNIFYFRNDKNRGLSYSRNYALSKAKGEFITHLDDDDYMTPDRIELFVDNWEDNKELLGLFTTSKTSSGKTIQRRKKKLVRHRDLLTSNLVGNTIFTKTKLLQNIKGYDENLFMMEDLDCWLNLSKNSTGYFKLVNKPTLVVDTGHEEDRMTNMSLDGYKKYLKVVFATNHIIKKYKIRRFSFFKLKTHLYAFFPSKINALTILTYILNNLLSISLLKIIRIYITKITKYNSPSLEINRPQITNDKISIIMSVYNEEEYIQKSIESIQNQTHENFELLIYDDGSEDSTYKIIKDIAEKDERITIFGSKKIGLTKALNFLIEQSKSDIIARQDADDFSHPKRLEKQLPLILNNKYDLITCRAYKDPSENITSQRLTRYFSESLVSNFKNPFIHGTYLMRKDTLLAINGYDESFKYAQDYKLIKDFLRFDFKIKLLDSVLYTSGDKEQRISKLHKTEQQYFASCAKFQKFPT